MLTETVIIYAEDLFFINFCLDLICLYITALICRREARHMRILCGAVIGGVYSLFCLQLESRVLSAVGAVICMAAICAAVFLPCEMRVFAVLCGVFALSAAFVGGIITAVYSLLGIDMPSVNALSLTATAVPVSFAVIYYLLSARRRKNADSARVVIRKSGVTIDTVMLIDSGNTAREPMSGLPLIFVSPSAVPPSLCQSAVCSIPVIVTTATSTEVMYCFIPDSVTVFRGNKKQNVRAAVVRGRGNDYCGTKGLLPASLI